MKILLLTGGRSSEREVAISSSRAVFSVLKKKFDAEIAEMTSDGCWLFSGEELSVGRFLENIYKNFDACVVMMHGEFGEDGKIQAMLESIGLPYTGSDVTSSAIAMDKHKSNIMYSYAGLHVPAYQYFFSEHGLDEYLASAEYPVFVKENEGGSSIGTFKVKTLNEARNITKELLRQNKGFIVQVGISGREFSCGVYERDGEIMQLPPTEIIPNSDFFDLDSKYIKGACKEETPANISSDMAEHLQAAAKTAHQILGCRDFSRSDFILTEDKKIYILETNTIPGFTETSLLPQQIQAQGMSMGSFWDLMISNAIQRKKK